MYAAAESPGSTGDERIWDKSLFFANALAGRVATDFKFSLGRHGDIQLATIKNNAFKRYCRLKKCYNENREDKLRRYFNKMLLVPELYPKIHMVCWKVDFVFLYKKPSDSLIIYLHNNGLHCAAQYIYFRKLPCQSRWQLEINELDFLRGFLIRQRVRSSQTSTGWK